MTIAHDFPIVIDLRDLAFDRGGHLLVARALQALEPGETLDVRGNDPHLVVNLRTWARSHGHRATGNGVTRGTADIDRWSSAVRAGGRSPSDIADRAPATWGLAARGALVESGGSERSVFDLDSRSAVWSDIAPKLYSQACASQWDPDTAIDWNVAFELDESVEDAVVQVMTYLVENEQAALIVPSRFIGRVHPHYSEVLQLLAIQLADEARHIEVFSRRAALKRDALGTSSLGGRTSLQTLFDESDFAISSFLLSVLGEGTFLQLLAFLERHGPDPITVAICRLALEDEARHVAFGLSHLEVQIRDDERLISRLASAVRRRHAALSSTAGLNEQVFDSLVLLAAGSWEANAIEKGWDAVVDLQREMDRARRRRLIRLGFTQDLRR